MKKLNSNHLKIIAIIAMTIDHVADLLYPGMPNIFISNGLGNPKYDIRLLNTPSINFYRLYSK